MKIKYYSDKHPEITEGFDTEEELYEAERAYEEKAAAIEERKQNRKNDFDLVKQAYQEAADKQKEANELYAQANAIKNDFIKKYGSIYFEQTIPISRSNIFDRVLDNFLFF